MVSVPFIAAGWSTNAGESNVTAESGVVLTLRLNTSGREVPAELNAVGLLVAVGFAVNNFFVLPELLWLLWVVVTSVYLTIRPPREPVRA